MPAIGEKGLREEIATALKERWANGNRAHLAVFPPQDYEVIGTGQGESIVKWCGEILKVKVEKI
jgi:hypothetical protein